MIILLKLLQLYSRIVDSVAILFKAYVNRTIQVYEEKGMTDDQVQHQLFFHGKLSEAVVIFVK